ncbi:MAG TPA: GntR family transcriptional regulator, partial [Cellvibrio sp.]
MIEAGDWLGGSPLPSSRDIAQRLGINRKTVSRVYEELSAQGLIYTQPKRGTFVAETVKRSNKADKALADQPPQSSAPHTETNSIESLIQKSSIHHLRRAALHLHKLRQADYDVTGLHHLKHLLANLLAHERRYLVPPEHIACGARQGLQQAILCNLDAAQGYVLIDPAVGTRLQHALKKHGIPVM